MKLTWHGHACFTLQEEDYTIIIDPFRDVPGYDNICMEVNEAYASHQHYDHCYFDELTMREKQDGIFQVKVVSSFHDAFHGEKRGTNRIHVFSAGQTKVVHLGDLGHVLNDEQIAELKGCDVLLVPVGGNYTLDAEAAREVCSQLKPKLTVPMHYQRNGKGIASIADVEPFLNLNQEKRILCSPDDSVDFSNPVSADILVMRWED